MSGALHCVYCGEAIDDGAILCVACRSPVARVGCPGCGRESIAGTLVCACGIRLEAPLRQGTPCPRCQAKMLRHDVTPDCALLECSACGGILCGPRAWSEMVDGATEGDPRFESVGAWTGATLPNEVLFRLVHCPLCQKEMDRITFAGRSKVSTDVCTLHGLWLDAGALKRALDVVRYRSAHDGDMPPPSGRARHSLMTTQERRAQVLESMGIADPQFALQRPALEARERFDANRLAGRVAFVAGGLEGVAAYGLLKVVAAGAGAAFEAALQASRPEMLTTAEYRARGEMPPLRCLFCGAVHDEDASTCSTCASPIARVTCPACGDRLTSGATKCICGAPVLPVASAHELACPRCTSALDAVPLEGGTVAQRCIRCLGAFFDIEDWTTVIDGSVADRPLPLAGFAPVPRGRRLPIATMLADASCPRCRQTMERITFATRTRVVVDVCTEHGIWLDAAELVALAAHVRAAATNPPPMYEEEEPMYQDEETNLRPSRMPPR